MRFDPDTEGYMAKAVRTHRNSRKAQTCLAVFLVALINLTMQPCVMAMQAMSSVAPPVQSEHCMQHGHQMAAQDMAPDGSCVDRADFLTDARLAGLDLKKLGDFSPLLAVLPQALAIAENSVAADLDPIPDRIPWSGSPPLRELYCTYLI